MLYLNLDLVVHCSLVLLISSNFSFVSIGHSFSRTFILLFLEGMHVHRQFCTNQFKRKDKIKQDSKSK